jgi:hypothetical protein
MKLRTLFVKLALCLGVAAGSCASQELPPFRPPAVPLVTHDPYFSIWSASDKLTDSDTVHWTGKPQSISAAIRIDGTTYRVMGRPRRQSPALEQTRVEVLPTRTLYEFSGGGIRLQLAFVTPALPDDLDVLSRPLTYIDWTVAAADGREHAVEFYFDASSELAVDRPDEPVVASRLLLDRQGVLRVGSREQPVLAKSGDDLRIDWGYLYLAADRPDGISESIGSRQKVAGSFAGSGRLPDSDDFSGDGSVLALGFALDKVGAQPVSRYLMIAYDDLYSIEYLDRRMRPWWRRNGADAAELLRSARRDHDAVEARSKAFDDELMADLRKVGGDSYARLAALAYRQTLAAHKLVADVDGTPMYFPKENFSNGCIATVDVIYPSFPFTLLFNPTLLRAQLQPVLNYARLDRWRWPFAPHDLGVYPKANGQVYGGGERTEEDQMPVEESANMLIMVAALARVEGNAEFAAQYWTQLSRWAEYLKVKGLDPENQLSTDDFAGHLAHNANLSVKAIVALGAYGMLGQMTGHQSEAAAYTAMAKDFAKKWMELGRDHDHYKLAFDKPGTWSQKYNLVWDRLLGLNLFPPEVARTEVTFYLGKMNRFGLPLDNRKDYTKIDWLLWTATLAEDPKDFDKLSMPAYRFANESPSRVPLTDWYDTVTGKQEAFQARSVVGGLFIKLMADPVMLKKYSQRGLARR